MWIQRTFFCILVKQNQKLLVVAKFLKKMSVFAEEFSCINPARYLGSNCEAFSGGVD
jgi:hypothetical protein